MIYKCRARLPTGTASPHPTPNRDIRGTLRGPDWIRDVTFAEDASKVRKRNAPAVLAALRDIVRSALRKAGWANTASARRAHTDPEAILNPHRIP